MELNKVLERAWPQSDLAVPIWSLEYDELGAIVISDWNETAAGRPKPNAAEIFELSQRFDAEAAAEKLVEAARRELFDSDWRMTVDKSAAMEPEALEAWKQYRAKLRDVVNGISDVLPKKPEVK